MQQAAAIYVRMAVLLLEDELLGLIHEDFRKQHGQGIAEADDDAIYQAVKQMLRDIPCTADAHAIRDAVETLTRDAWATIEGGES